MGKITNIIYKIVEHFAVLAFETFVRKSLKKNIRKCVSEKKKARILNGNLNQKASKTKKTK